MSIYDLEDAGYDDPYYDCDHAGGQCPDGCDCPCEGCEMVRDETAS